MVRKFAEETARWRERKQEMRDRKKQQKAAAAGADEMRTPDPPRMQDYSSGSETDDGAGVMERSRIN